MSFWKVPATSAFVHLALPPCPCIALNYDRNLFVYTFEMIKIEIMPLNAKTSLNDMLISASFGHGQLKSIKNQSHPHFHFDTHRSGCEGKDKLNKTSTRDGKSHHGVLNGFAVFLFYETQHVEGEDFFIIFLPRRGKTQHCAILSLIFTHIWYRWTTIPELLMNWVFVAKLFAVF